MALSGKTGLVLQERDFAVLLGLFESRVMTLAHITALYFGGKAEMATKRMQRLKAAGYAKERARSIGSPSILHLSKQGFLTLRDNGYLQRYPQTTWEFVERRVQVSDLTLRHELEVMDVKAAFSSSLASSTYSLAEFSTWPVLYQFSARRFANGDSYRPKEMVVKPDAFIRLIEKTDESEYEHAFFLEVDRSTETQETVCQKAVAYLDYYQSGGFAEKMGARRGEFREYPFRVLMVFKNDERRNNVAERLLLNEPPILTQTCLTTMKEVLENPFGEIWMTPKDYLVVTENTCFAANSRRNVSLYRRNKNREALLSTIIKKSLFD